MGQYAGYVLIFVAAICWGFLGILGRMAMDFGLTPWDVAFWRAFVGGAFLFMHAFAIKQAKVHSAKDFGFFCLFGACSIATFFVAYQFAIREGGAALASVLLYTAPAWVAVFSRIFFGLPFTAITSIAIGVALLGCTFISVSPDLATAEGAAHMEGGQSSLPLLGIAFGLLSGFLYATHYVVTKKFLVKYTPFTLYGYSSLVAALCLFPMTSFHMDLSFTNWLIIIAMGFVSTYVAYWAYCESMKRLHPTKVAVLATLEPVVATVAAWAIWGENFSALGWVGAVLILSTVIIFLVDDKRRLTKA